MKLSNAYRLVADDPPARLRTPRAPQPLDEVDNCASCKASADPPHLRHATVIGVMQTAGAPLSRRYPPRNSRTFASAGFKSFSPRLVMRSSRSWYVMSSVDHRF